MRKMPANSTSQSRLVMAVINDLTADQRIHRIASTLQQDGWQVLVIGRQLKDSLPISPRPYATKRMKLWFTRGKLFYIEYNLRLLFLLLAQNIQLINSNDLDTLLACSLAAQLKRIPLVYDAHELFTELPELIHRPRTQMIWKRLEQWLLPRVHKAYTVNASLAQEYQDRYQLPFIIIRNVPLPKTTLYTSKRRNTPQKVLIYQGSLNVGRGIELMIDAMTFLPEYVLWIIGKGDIQEALSARRKSSPHPHRIIFKGFIPFEELYQLTNQAFLGFSLEENLGANYQYASPNKVYDYLQAAVPVVVSDLPEMRKIVEYHKVGEILLPSERKAELLAKKVYAILEDEEKYQQYVLNCQLAAEELNWERESSKLRAIYSQYK